MNGTIASEDELLGLIDRYFPREHRSLALGRGDDCAELRCPETVAVSTDLFLEDVHFRRSYFLPEEIGHKALAVNLSDLAGAGAVPLAFSVGFMAPAPFDRDVAEGILRGMARLAGEYDVPLSGGDISRAEKIGFCITVFGARHGDKPFLRRGPVTPGDAVFLAGYPGLARAGLTVLEEQGREAVADFPECCMAHLTPRPLLAEGQGVAKISGCRLMDLSDGLARDLPRLVAGCGAALELREDDLHPALLAFCRKRGEGPVAFAFAGGEEYGLLGTCPESAFAALRKAVADVPLLRLGRVGGAGITLNGETVLEKGFDHFSGA